LNFVKKVTMINNLYPLQFEPILKERIWGGEKLKSVLNKPITSKITGESWEISAVQGDVSLVSNGFFKGKSLTALIDSYPIAILGSVVYERFGKHFPLLFKYLDARDDLSIQVHPNDELAKKRHQSFGKTEMWYIMQADENARVIIGFKEKSSPKLYLDSLKQKTILTNLDSIQTKKGDVFFLETGTVHAIGAGLVIAEIQQTSDITYRIYDFDRVDANGKTRELHVDLALEAINYNVVDTKKEYPTIQNQSNEIVDCPYFTTNLIPLDGLLTIQNNGDSFKVYMCVEGHFDVITNGIKHAYQTGDTILIPAAINDFDLVGKASVLEIYIK
jgi:mannose-6-phosphate isomerase